MRYEAPDTIDAAIAILAAEDGIARVLAGGTDLLVQIRSDMIEPDLVVDIKNINSMRSITPENGGYRIGGAVSCAEMGEHADLCAQWPGVVEAAELIGSTQVQGRATMTGNLCNCGPAADSVPAMVAAEAIATIVGPNGRRDIPVEDMPVAPGKSSLTKGEIVESVFLPARPERSGDAYLRFIPRTEMDIAVVGVGISLTLDGHGTCTHARVGLGAVAATVLLVDDAAKALIGTRVDDAALDKLAAATSAACKPINDKRGTIEFRTKVAGVLAQRVAKIALDRAGK
ncbi:MAG: xanthine dehydrogenase family protein subunit M [Rhodospirillales bacterium]|jgi:CO/xanthine dehydrogenase FAD-binding subunit|nr:xanthine dehydrogenase family protein subunit M [Rhodospirillales bacterium]MBT4041747.1 xanthine dehydrogenase family protein subunit M [Rhodospirillales bacterium]MBT4627926.1 xanthine dehydrogenase family protein subunit M [Rhodospirillales bacterium]MBT5350659.1 xanthine dehydrogenase family protein subunit M [Rhodospirillales bacterium]MBT5520582.1 xanthine dehydrogenase family protein subunit M [Rhodospirillales bacterium]